MRVLEANCVTILPTNVCTAKCRHCSMNAGPDRSDTLSWPQLESIINQLFDEMKNLQVVVFSGGEATLLGEDLHKALRLCKQRNPKIVTRLVSNAFWATSPEDAEAKLRGLKDAGLDELNISTDDYHLPWISLQRVKWAWEAAKTMGFLSLALANAYGPESALTPERVDAAFGQGSPMQKRFGEDGFGLEQNWKWDQTNILLSNMLLSHLGRANDGILDGEAVEMGEKLSEMGDLMSGCPWAIRSAAISAKGHFVSCCGFEVEDNPILDYGDLNQHSLAELMDKADNDLISNMIAIIGPPQLKRILEKLAPDEISFPRKDYQSYCEVCEDLVGIAQNRKALYKYQHLFFDTITDVRQQYTEQYTVNERVKIPAGTRFQYKFDVVADHPEDAELAFKPRNDPDNPPLIPQSRLTQRLHRDDSVPAIPPSPCRGAPR